MTSEPQLSRRGERKRLAAAKADACQKSKIASRRMTGVVRKARMILAVPDFVETIYKHGIQTMPKILGPRRQEPRSHNGDPESSKEYLNNASLDFIVVWKFFFPLFSNPLVAASIERVSPGFILEMKDVFISVVIDGPFPLSGNRERRHRENLFGNVSGPQEN